MADKLMKDHLYGDLLAPEAGRHTDFALGMTYSLSFEAMLTAHLAFGMLGEMDSNAMQMPHLLLEAIAKSSSKVVVFCNKGGIAVPPTMRKIYSLLEDNIFEVFDRRCLKANFHPKLWLIREVGNDNDDDVQLKLIVTSRNLDYTDNIDCIASLTGRVGRTPAKARSQAKHRRLADFIKAVAKASNIGTEQEKRVLKLADDLLRVERFDVEAPFDDYDFFPYLFGRDFGLGHVADYMTGAESTIISPFIDKSMLSVLAPADRSRRTLITRKEYADPDIFAMFDGRGGTYITLDDLASRGIDLHAKMYHVWQGRDKQYLFLGSANATTSAFNRNGEFLLRLKYRYGNTQSGRLLREFYEQGNADSKFMPLNAPVDKAVSPSVWDSAEEAMKQLACADTLKAEITRHRDGSYSATVSATVSSLPGDIHIAPLQKRALMQRWTGRAKFDNLHAADLSVFYIVAATTADGVRHETIVKIATTGMPAERDMAIYKGIIKDDNDFFKFLALMLTDTPIQYIANEMHSNGGTGDTGDNDATTHCHGLYEKMLKAAATDKAQIQEIGRLANRLGDDIVPAGFKKMYDMFAEAIKPAPDNKKQTKQRR